MNHVKYSRVTNDWILVYLHDDMVGEIKVRGDGLFEIKYADTTIKNIRFQSVAAAKQFIEVKLSESMRDDTDYDGAAGGYDYEPFEGC